MRHVISRDAKTGNGRGSFLCMHVEMQDIIHDCHVLVHAYELTHPCVRCDTHGLIHECDVTHPRACSDLHLGLK